jgi:hypothetical protein
MDEQGLALLRSAMRTDLTTPGAIPTGAGIQMVTHRDQVLGFALVCEAVYVQLYNARSVEDILAYLEGPLQIRDLRMRRYILRMALRVREVLAACAGERSEAARLLMTDPGAEPAVVDGIIEACVRTAGEYAIPWTTAYFPGYRPRLSRAGTVGGAILAVCALALLYGLYQLVRHVIG